uniref:Uncharacterized protein n=1 Tax=Rhodosorus marinus TaxID=101924 RepID=A0A7S3A7M4_9RHOD
MSSAEGTNRHVGIRNSDGPRRVGKACRKRLCKVKHLASASISGQRRKVFQRWPTDITCALRRFSLWQSARLLARADPRHDRESGSTDEHRSPVMQVFLKTSNLQDAVASQAQRRSKPIPHASPSPIGQMEFSIRPMDDSSTSTTATRPGQTTPQRSREQNRASQEHPHLPFSNDPSKPDPTTNRA